MKTRRNLLTVFTLSILLSLLGPCESQGAETPAKKAPPKKKTATAGKATPTPVPRLPIYDPLASGTIALELTGKACLASSRRLFVNFGTNDCELCYVVNSAMHDEAFAKVFMKQFIPLFIDVTPGTKNAELLDTYKIDLSKGLPAIAVLDLVSKTSDITRQGEMVEAAKKGPEAIQAFIKRYYQEETSQ